MSKTDKTRPWWVQLVDAPGTTCAPVHDHRWGPCTLPREAVAVRALPGRSGGGCRWSGIPAYWVRRCESRGYREWSVMRREERRRSRHDARRDLHAGKEID